MDEYRALGNSRNFVGQVSHDDHGEPIGLSQIVDQRVHFMTQSRVKIGEGLIQKQQRTLLNQAAGQRRPLPLATGYLCGQARGDLG